jgi:TPR repeat protein
MANREELSIIRGARGGRATAQLELGKRYLFGSAGLPRSLPTALHWLERAATQDCAEAWELIGEHIPYVLASQSQRPVTLWYERAYDSGVAAAGLVLAQLVLGATGPVAGPGLRAKALRALEAAAADGVAEAQWLLSQQRTDSAPSPVSDAVAASAPLETPQLGWLKRAADGGVAEARFALLEQAWLAGQHEDYLARALPLARALRSQAAVRGAAPLSVDETSLLARCAQALANAPSADSNADELRDYLELAAVGHERSAQLALGLWYARMQVDGKRVATGAGSANFKKAIRWLTLAGEQGLAVAWYALSRIFIKPEFSQRNVVDALRYLERAAQMGYRDAQLECGNSAWRARRENESNDVRAVYWLQKAAVQGCRQAEAALRKIAPRSADEEWADLGPHTLAQLALTHPLLAARLELAAIFGLNRAEALLLDIKTADQGHCLVVDIRSSYGRSKRRLLLINSAQERVALDRIVRLFEHIDAGPGGQEGNYRQRLYRLKTLLPETIAPVTVGRVPNRFGLAA